MPQDAIENDTVETTAPGDGAADASPELAPVDTASTPAPLDGSLTPQATVEADAAAPTADAPVSDMASGIEMLFGVDALRDTGERVLAWLQSRMLTFDFVIEAVLLVAALAPAAMFGPQLKRVIAGQIAPRAPHGVLRRAANAFAHVATPLALLITLQIAVIALGAMGRSSGLVQAGVSLLTAWIIIRLVSLVIRSPFWSKVAFYVAWPIAALDAFGMLGNVVAQLEAFSFPIGEDANGVAQRFSALDFVRTAAVFGVLFWGANFAGGFLKGRIDAIDELTVSFKALLGKILDVLLPVVALVAALQFVGFPFGTLAIFGGAVGLGIGLGMQRTVSNFFAGFTLIADKSIKPGDVIEIDGAFGWVTQMNARYVSLRTRDGTDHLVPNDKFIQEGVNNWSHKDRHLRLHAPFGIAYGTDDLRGLARRMEAMVVEIDRVLEHPKPRCNLMAFGDSSIDFDLRFWINDPANGVSNVRSDVFMAIWDVLKEEGIEIPFPQREVHLMSAPALEKTPGSQGFSD
ncbi:MAG: mechanosensitive ion channel domain-containing protein [Pseudomonadota bacterium]